MQAGETIGRRFVLVRADDEDLPGLVRYLAKDTRLGTDVTVDIVSSLAPSAVIRAAQRVRVLRDKRLTRVLAAGTERRGDDRVSYIVTERPAGVRLDELLGRVAFAPASAAAVIGEAAAALLAVVGSGEHHGMVRASSITVTTRGRVVVSGLGIDGELASQAGLVKGRTERADAVALTRLYLAAITAKDPADATKADIPSDVSRAARTLCHQLLKGAGPESLAAVTAALGTGDAGVLKALVAEAPSLWWPWAPAVVELPVELPVDVVEVADEAEVETPVEIADERVSDEPVSELNDDAPQAATDTAELELVENELVNGELVTVDDDMIDGDVVEVAPARPRTRFGGAVDDLDEFHDIVAAQNVGPAHSVAEALLERLHQRFPQSSPLATAAAAAHRRANAAAPLNIGPLLVALLLVAVFVAAIVGASLLTKPYVPNYDGHNNPPQTYPEFTVGATPEPGSE